MIYCVCCYTNLIMCVCVCVFYLSVSSFYQHRKAQTQHQPWYSLSSFPSLSFSSLVMPAHLLPRFQRRLSHPTRWQTRCHRVRPVIPKKSYRTVRIFRINCTLTSTSVVTSLGLILDIMILSQPKQAHWNKQVHLRVQIDNVWALSGITASNNTIMMAVGRQTPRC